MQRTMTPNALLRALVAGVLSVVASAPALADGRVLTKMDVVSIRVVDQPDLDTTTRVELDGTINFPYIGRMRAAGLTEDELEHAIARRLVQLKILADP